MKPIGFGIVFILVMVTPVSGQVHFTPVDTTGLPYIIVITGVQIDTESIAGCEIGVFDDTLCVGSALYDGLNNVQITAWEGSEALGLPGFVTGNIISYKIRAEIGGEFKELVCTAEYEKGNGRFGYGSYSVAVLNTSNSLVVKFSETKDLEWVFSYPNPFNSRTNFECILPANLDYMIGIYNLTGARVFYQNGKTSDKGMYIFSWNGKSNSGNELPCGAYFLNIRSGQFQAISKITYLK